VQPGLAPPSTPALGQNQGNQSNSPFGFSGNQGFGGNSPFGFGGNQGLGANGINFNAIQGLARVAADASTNTIIVIGPPSVQDAYEELIEFLDRRPQQVLIEARVVILDTTDDYSLGVEVSVGDRSGERRLLEFTSFGLSDVDPVSGALSLIPGRGLNWTLVDPSQADVVLRALASHRRARVTSTPRILVNDNKTGTLASVAEVPFTSVNASQTVATTSFAGFAEAGTSIEVTPRISDEDLLQLEFTVSLNSFTGPGGDGVPPPRQTDELSSEVTIPDGHTVIIGGLNTSGSQDGIPFIENIPILKELTSITTKNSSNATLFFFLRPIILRDDKFEDLKFISESDAAKAGIQGAFPASSPILVQ
jgi:general secretion pathway protein D